MLNESPFLHLIILPVLRHQETSSRMKNGTKAVTLFTSSLLSFSFLACMILRLFVLETFGLGLLGLAGILRACNTKTIIKVRDSEMDRTGDTTHIQYHGQIMGEQRPLVVNNTQVKTTTQKDQTDVG